MEAFLPSETRPEFWIALRSGGAVLVIAARRLLARKAEKQEVAA